MLFRSVKEDDSKIYMLRDGDTTSKTSAHIFKNSNKLWVWSTSTPLESQKAYSAADLTIELCYNGDKKAFVKDQKRYRECKLKLETQYYLHSPLSNRS